MSYANPHVYICSVCGSIDLENYEDYHECIYCGGLLTKTKYDLSDYISNILLRPGQPTYAKVLCEYCYNRDGFDINMHKIIVRESQYSSLVEKNTAVSSPCPRCGCCRFTRRTWYDCSYNLRNENTCHRCGRKWIGVSTEDLFK